MKNLDLICPYCERKNNHQELGRKDSGGLKIKCGYCKKKWVETSLINKKRKEKK